MGACQGGIPFRSTNNVRQTHPAMRAVLSSFHCMLAARIGSVLRLSGSRHRHFAVKSASAREKISLTPTSIEFTGRHDTSYSKVVRRH